MVKNSGQICLPFFHNARVCRTDVQTEFSSLDRVCIPGSSIKIRDPVKKSAAFIKAFQHTMSVGVMTNYWKHIISRPVDELKIVMY